MAINATEIARQAEKVREKVETFKHCFGRLSVALGNIANESRSENSDLSALLNNYSRTLTELETKLRIQFSIASTKMKDYANQTIENERATVEEINKLNNQLTSIKDKLKSVKLTLNN